jgi:hypothetical protein
MALASVLCATFLSGCWPFDTTTSTTSSPQPTFTVPTVPTTTGTQPLPTTPAPTTPTPTTPAPTAPAPTTAYPLNEQQAMAIVTAGGSVTGRARNGGEVTIRQSVETTTEHEQVQKQVCADEYDYDERKYVNKCRYKYVDEPVQKTTTRYVISGQLSASFTNAAGPFAQASAIGATFFRRG